MHQITKKSAWGVAIRIASGRLQLNQCVACADPVLELWLARIDLVVPHQLDIADRTRIIEQEEEMLEQLQIFLKFPLERPTQNSLNLFHGCLAPNRSRIL